MFEIELSKILAVIYLAALIASLSNKKRYSKIVKDLYENSALVYVSGMFTLAIGMILLLLNDVWTLSLSIRGFVTLIIWIMTIKGFSLIAFPEFMEKISQKMIKKVGDNYFPIMLLIATSVFGYIGYFMN